MKASLELMLILSSFVSSVLAHPIDPVLLSVWPLKGNGREDKDKKRKVYVVVNSFGAGHKWNTHLLP